MIEPEDVAYYHERAAAERALSQQASCAAAALAHETLAERYEQLASRGQGRRPTLHIVTSRRDA